jgi:hypothetical protein
LLGLATEFSGTAYVLAGGQVIITSKGKALELNLVRARGYPEGELLNRLLYPEGPSPWGEAAPLERPASPLEARPKLPDYLQSDRAFLRHIEELLKPAPVKPSQP